MYNTGQFFKKNCPCLKKRGVVSGMTWLVTKKAAISFILIIALAAVFFVPAGASAITIQVRIPVDVQTFSVDLDVNESEAYAGIQFGLTLSDNNALEFVSFTLGESVSGATDYPFIERKGVHSFGFWTGTNGFQGNHKVGKLSFKYTGNDPQTITITEMMVMRIDTENNRPYGTYKETPVYIVQVSRETSGAGGIGTGGTGGNSIATIVIEDDNKPLAEVEKKSKYFKDVPEESWPWAVNEIDFLFEAGVINGTSPGMYSPAAQTLRRDFILMLVRAYDLLSDFDDNFTDVPRNSYYYDAVGAAKKLGIARGVGGNAFAPGSPITRQDMMVLVSRTLDIIGKPLPTAPQSVLTKFSDYTQISGYARGAVAALVQADIIKGNGTGINPLGNTTRAEMAVVLYRILTTAE